MAGVLVALGVISMRACMACLVFYGAAQEGTGRGSPHVRRTTRPIRKPRRAVLCKFHRQRLRKKERK